MASSATKFDSDCTLMLHMDGADASTTFTDSSFSTQKTVTPVGDAQIDTAQSVFGGASGLFDGTGDYLTIPDSADWDFGTADFTIDFRIRFNGIAGPYRIFDFGDGVSTTGIYCDFINGNLLEIYMNTATKNKSWTPITLTWYHLTLVRTSGTLRVFVDGTQLGTDSVATEDLTGSTQGVHIATGNVTNVPLNGWLDEFRAVKGTAVWTANFTPPTAAYTKVTSTARSSRMMLMGIS